MMWESASLPTFVLGYAASVLLHGLYDSTAMLADHGNGGIFLPVVVAIYAIVFWLVRVASRHDQRFAW